MRRLLTASLSPAAGTSAGEATEVVEAPSLGEAVEAALAEVFFCCWTKIDPAIGALGDSIKSFRTRLNAKAVPSGMDVYSGTHGKKHRHALHC